MEHTNYTDFAADAALGKKIVNYTIYSMATMATLAAAWACSSVVLGIIVLIIMAIITALITLCIKVYLAFTVSNESFADLGSKVGAGVNSVRAFFTRKPATLVQE